MKYKVFLLFIIVLLTCSMQPAKTESHYDGIDVSHHQGHIDWKKVSENKSIQFVYIKATEGSTYIDKCFDYNVSMALKYKMKVGVYHFFSTKSSPESQFRHFNKTASKYKTSLIPMLDIEIALSSSYSKRTAVKNIRKFIELVKKEYGVYPVIYGTQRSYNTVCSPYFNDCILYIGRYGNKEPEIITKSGILQHKYSIWQFSDKGKVNGIPKQVDLCKFNKKVSIQDITL